MVDVTQDKVVLKCLRSNSSCIQSFCTNTGVEVQCSVFDSFGVSRPILLPVSKCHNQICRREMSEDEWSDPAVPFNGWEGLPASVC